MKSGRLLVILFSFIVGLVMIALPGSSSAEKVIEIKANAFHPVGHRLHSDAYEQYGRYIEKLTNGKVKFKWFAGGTLIPMDKTYDGLKSGLCDWAYIIPAWNPNEFVLTNAINLPFMARDSAHAAAILWQMSKEFPEMKAEYKNMVPLFWFSTAPVHIHSNKQKHTPKTLEDLKGLRCGCPGPIFVKYMNTLDMAGQQVNQGDLYTALQRGMIEAILFPEAPLRSQGLTDLVDYHLMMSFGVDVFAAGMNVNSWKKLPEDVKQVFLDTAQSFGALCGATITNESGWVMDELGKRGDEIYYLPDSEKSKMKKVLQPYFDEWIEKIGKRGMDGEKMLKRIDEISKEVLETPYTPDDWWGRAGKKE